MITSLEFNNFRGFKDFKISPAKSINLIAGANNTGKTGILEGLLLLCTSRERVSEDVADLPGRFRSNVYGKNSGFSGAQTDDFFTFWQALFYDKDLELAPCIAARVNHRADIAGCVLLGDKSGDIIWIKHFPPNMHGVPENPAKEMQVPPAIIIRKDQLAQVGPAQTSNQFAMKCIVISTRMEDTIKDSETFNQVSILGGAEEKLVALLREVDPRLEKLRYVKAPGTHQPLVYAHFGLKNALSITQTGQGFSKLFSIFCQMLVSKAKVLLIDEIENGLYFESLPVIWKGLCTLARSEGIQIFATTHSRECIVAAHETFKDTPDYDFALHRLQRVKGRIEAVTHDRGMLEVAIKSGMEVR